MNQPCIPPVAQRRLSKRSGVAKFILGPDYKNAGEVNDVVAELNENIDTLNTLKEDTWGQDSEDIQAAIDNLQDEIVILESELEEQTTGFSLFGWLGKLISSYK